MSEPEDVTQKRFEDIGVSLEGHVATVEIRRPPSNFFDHALIAQLADAFEGLDAHPDCRALVLAAEGKAFCAGANFGSGQSSDPGHDEFSEQGFQNTTGKLYRAAVRLFRSRKPVVAAVQGAAVGGGLGVALVPDFRVACPEARFSANFAKLGIHPGFGLTVTLPALVGEQRAQYMFYTGVRVKGKEALEWGLADRLVPKERLREAARELAEEIAGNAPLAVQSVRATLRQGLAERIERATEHELREQQWLRRTSDAQEGIRAVSERRPGKFQGR